MKQNFIFLCMKKIQLVSFVYSKNNKNLIKKRIFYTFQTLLLILKVQEI